MATFTGSDKAIAFLFDMVANMADDYDSTSAYSVGDYAVYDGTLYKCTSAISTPEDFTPAHWTAVLIMNEVSAGGGGGGSTTLAGLSDVALSAVSNGDVLTYDSSLNKWKNAAGGGGSGYSRTNLFTGEKATQGDTVALSGIYTNFDYLEVTCGFHLTSTFYNKLLLIPTTQIVLNSTFQFCEGLYRQPNPLTSGFISFSFTATNEITIDQIVINGQMAAKILKVDGITF